MYVQGVPFSIHILRDIRL